MTTKTKMPVSEESLSDYLSSVSPLWKAEIETKKFNIIMGNEAGDADSIISALTLPYVKDVILKDKNEYTNLPVVSIVRDDLPLRRDATLLLEMAGIKKDNLLFLDDVTQQSIDKERTVMTLVDHNKVRPEFVDAKVVEICDHHQDERQHLEDCSSRQIEFDNDSKQALVGSTCTLVAEKFMQHYDGRRDTPIDAQLGLALLGVILLDTMNMSTSAGKGTPRDGKAIEFLQSQTRWEDLVVNNSMDPNVMANLWGDRKNNADPMTSINVTWFYEFLRDSKFDSSFWDSLSARDALRMDYKRFETTTNMAFGMSSVLQVDVALKPNFLEEAEAYMTKEAEVDLLLVLTLVIIDDEPKRSLMILGNEELVSNLCDFLLHHESAAFLEISKESDETKENATKVIKLKQGNPKGSRKQVAPVVLSFFPKNKI